MGSNLMKYFKFDHLPPHLQAVSKPFFDLAEIINSLPATDRDMRDAALQKLIEAKDCAVRAMIP